MEDYSQSVYSVLEKTKIREKMMNEINHISEMFSVSKSDATVILIHLQWNSYKASELLGGNKEKLLGELRLVRVSDSNQNESKAERETIVGDGNGDDLVSTPFCSHKFSKNRWNEYLIDYMEKNKAERGLISCLYQDCVASVGPDMIEQLTEPVKKMYEDYVLSSFVESNKTMMKWCPASGCEYVIEIEKEKEEDAYAVVCLCGYIFCWNCELESHQPMTCKNASFWLKYLLDNSRSITWIHLNTRRCPECNRHVQRNCEQKLITCVCSYSFCWICLCTKEEHNGNWNCVEIAVPPPESQEKVGELSPNEFSQIYHMELWQASHETMENAKANLKAFETMTIPKLVEKCGLSEADIKIFKEAWMLVVQCRGVVKWSWAFAYFITEDQEVKKQCLSHLRDEATIRSSKHEEALCELIDELITGTHSTADFGFIKRKLKTSSSNTVTYFNGYLKRVSKIMENSIESDE